MCMHSGGVCVRAARTFSNNGTAGIEWNVYSETGLVAHSNAGIYIAGIFTCSYYLKTADVISAE